MANRTARLDVPEFQPEDEIDELFSRGNANPTGSNAATDSTAVAEPVQIDLRHYSVSRTDQQAPTLEPVQLMRDSLDLTILLPVGSEPGPYDVQLLDSVLRPEISVPGHAEIENFVTTLRTTMDLRSVPAGAYELALRHQGDDRRLYPASVR